MTKVEELKKMYENMGGDPEAVADKTLITEMLDAMSELELSELPDVTADDNGDVLTVVEGVWSKATPAGSLPAVTADDNGDVLTVVDGAWGKAVTQNNVVIFESSYINKVTMTGDSTLKNGKTLKDLSDTLNSGKLAVIKILGYDDTAGQDGETFLFPVYRYNNGGGIVFMTMTRLVGHPYECYALIDGTSTGSTFTVNANRLALYSEIPTT